MARYNEKIIPYALQDRLMDTFCEALSRLKTKSAIRNFLKDLLNRQERLMLVRRLLIAEMLLEEKTYQEIIAQLHCGFSTVAKVERWLHFGRGGYKEAVEVRKKD
ncbi:MAG: YerC/YecD family TrpR-related protein [bacterium]|nr:YerC/YecD family TrpR-related protein [bacterium]